MKRFPFPLLLLLMAAPFAGLFAIFGLAPLPAESNRSSDEDHLISGENGMSRAFPVGTIVPQPSTPETFSETPTPLIFRVVNRGEKSVFLQGVRQGEEKIQLYFYHREAGTGWKPFFDTLPCDLPTCRNLHVPKQSCGQGVPFAVSLGPTGTSGSVKELKWDGLLYQRIEATQEDRQRRYCYKGWVPKSGRIRIEIEFSETAQIGKDRNETIGGRDHSVLEFDLPPMKEAYDILVGH
jgi:hypothetical protein